MSGAAGVHSPSRRVVVGHLAADMVVEGCSQGTGPGISAFVLSVALRGSRPKPRCGDRGERQRTAGRGRRNIQGGVTFLALRRGGMGGMIAPQPRRGGLPKRSRVDAIRAESSCRACAIRWSHFPCRGGSSWLVGGGAGGARTRGAAARCPDRRKGSAARLRILARDGAPHRWGVDDRPGLRTTDVSSGYPATCGQHPRGGDGSRPAGASKNLVVPARRGRRRSAREHRRHDSAHSWLSTGDHRPRQAATSARRRRA